jgi:hypothetical protein
MTEGISTFMGLAVPLYGESEIHAQSQTLDILTITHSSAGTGDFIVAQGYTGTEVFVVSSSGLITATGLALTGVSTITGGKFDLAISSTVSTNYGIKFTMGASAVAAALIDYTAGITAATTAYLGVASSNGPANFLSVSGSAGHGVGAAANNGFFTASKFFSAAPSTTTVIGAIKMLAGSKAYYILSVPDTTLA